MKKAPEETRVEIGGHTDNTGNAAANLKLSEARAAAVRARLVELGVSDAILTATGYDDTKPVADNGTTDGRAKNRRMEFSLAQ
ncbi:MAG TPA: OmpA family protein [Pseudoxanthomonas sp.]